MDERGCHVRYSSHQRSCPLAYPCYRPLLDLTIGSRRRRGTQLPWFRASQIAHRGAYCGSWLDRVGGVVERGTSCCFG